jgi:hypothetical protein
MWPGDKLESNRTPKFIARGTGVNVASELTYSQLDYQVWKFFLGWTMSRKSVLERLSTSRLADIQEPTLASTKYIQE